MPKRPERYWETSKRRKPAQAPNPMRQRTILPAQVLECLDLSRAKITAADIARTIGHGATAGQVADLLYEMEQHNLVERTARKKYPPLFGRKNRGN